MKLETIISIYNINTKGVSIATLNNMLPDIEKMDAQKAVEAISNAVASASFSEMEKEKNAAELDILSKCNICKKQGNLVTLSRNRPVFYCEKHNTINPIPIELIKKLEFDYEPTR